MQNAESTADSFPGGLEDISDCEDGGGPDTTDTISTSTCVHGDDAFCAANGAPVGMGGNVADPTAVEGIGNGECASAVDPRVSAPCATAGVGDKMQKMISSSPCPVTPHPLPEGWVAIRHVTGANVYFHRDSRVCSWSRPYSIKKGMTVRKHPVPVWSIPCLQEWLYRDPESEHATRWRRDCEEKGKRNSMLAMIDPDHVEEYLGRLWPVKYSEPMDEAVGRGGGVEGPPVHKKRKLPSKPLASDTQLPAPMSQTVAVQIPDHVRKCALRGGCKSVPKEWSVNPANKSAVQILNEFLQLCPIGILEFTASEGKDANEPYLSTVLINKISYGQARSSTKKHAKQLAAEKALNTLLPNTFNTSFQKKEISSRDYEYFAAVPLDEPRLAAMCTEAGVPLPNQLLTECANRHQGILPDTNIKFSVAGQNDTLEYTMSLGSSHSVTGVCTNKKDGKQLAAQALLQELHPFLGDWGSMLRFYAEPKENMETLDTKENSREPGRLRSVEYMY